MSNMDNTRQEIDICRVCHLEGKPEQPLYHPCLCTGSIMYVHQKCLLAWMKHSDTVDCALCNYQYSFTPVFASDMPDRISIIEVVAHVMSGVPTKIKRWLHLTLSVILWLFVLPVTVCRIRRILFQSSFDAVMSLSIDMWSPTTMIMDIFYGCSIIICTSIFFYKIKRLQEKILEYWPDWLERDEPIQYFVFLPTIYEDDEFAEETEEEIFQEDNEEDEDDFDPMNPGILFNFFGFDGSFEYLHLLFFIGFLNITIILSFGVLPYKFGFLALKLMNLQDKLGLSQFGSSVIILYGYCLIVMSLSIVVSIVTITGCRPYIQHKIGVLYINLKVILAIVFEVVVIPIAIGWWLNICSSPMFGTNLNDHLANFHSAPFTSMFINWLLFVVFVYYFHWCLELIPNVIRHDVLRNIVIRDHYRFFLQRCIQGSMWQIGQHMIILILMYGTAIFFTLWIPLKILKIIWPSFLPCYVILNNLGYSLFIIEILILVFTLVFSQILQKQLHNKVIVALRFWFSVVSNLFGLKSYLFIDEEEIPPFNYFRSYTRPTNFIIRLIALSIMVMVSLIMIILLVIIIPVLLGHLIVLCWTILLLVFTKLFQLQYINYVCSAMCSVCLSFLLVKFLRLIEPDRRFLVINTIKFCIQICNKIIVLSMVPIILLLSILFFRAPFEVPFITKNNSTTYTITKYLYQTIMPIVIMVTVWKIILKTIYFYRQLYMRVMINKYLIGQELVNYDRTVSV